MSANVNFISYLQNKIQSYAEKPAFIFLANGENEQESLTYALLHNKAQSIAGYLQANAQVGDRILLCFLPGLDFITAFIGCLYAGMIAVPAYPLRNNHHAKRLLAIIEDCDPTLIMGTRESLLLMQQQEEFTHYRYTFTEELPDNILYKQKKSAENKLAFLQYTSGSTGTPKGVIVSHGNIFANMQAIHYFFDLGSNDKIISWLPVQHDMGLIGNLLYTLFLGTTEILMPPTAFLEKPLRWLQAISNYQGYAAGGPNFGYQLCVDKIPEEEISTLDLSSWQTAFNGSEPIRALTLQAFAHKFAPSGFKLQKFLPCFGMAETTLLVSGKNKKSDPVIMPINKELLMNNLFVKETGTRDLVSSGEIYKEYTVKIVNPNTNTLANSNEVGEIWISGPSVAQGYWNKKQLTQKTFQAKLPGDKKYYLRTGDLGYVDGEELYITGRLKDLIILQGRNVYPQDVELAVESCSDAIRAGCTAAFSVETENQEQLVIVAEINRAHRKKDFQAVFQAIRQAVMQSVEVIPYSIQLLAPAKALRTTSGKIQRQATKVNFLSGNLETLASDDLPSENSDHISYEKLENDIGSLLGKILGLQQIDPQKPFTFLGGTSLEAITFQQQLQNYLGKRLNVSSAIAFEYPTVRELASYLYNQLISSRKVGELTPSNWYADAPRIDFPPLGVKNREEKLPLSINEQTAWVANQEKADNVYLNMKTLLFIDSPINKNLLEEAFNHIIKKHEILRTTYHQDEQGVLYRKIHDHRKMLLTVYDWDNLSVEEQKTKLRYVAQKSEHKRFCLDSLNLFECILIRLKKGQFALLFCMHHIIGDGASIIILLNEILKAYQHGEETSSTPAISYVDYAAWQQQSYQQQLFSPLLSYWENTLLSAQEVLLPYDAVKGAFPSQEAARVSIKLGQQTIKDLLMLAHTKKVSLQIVFVGAFLLLLKKITYQNTFLLETILSNRITKEKKELIGALATDAVALYSVEEGQSINEFLTNLLQQTLIMSRLLQDCGSLIYNTVSRKLPGNPVVGINFHAQNYAANFSIPVRMDASYFARNSMPGSLDLFLEIWPGNDEIILDFIYRQSLFKKKTIEDITVEYVSIIKGFF